MATTNKRVQNWKECFYVIVFTDKVAVKFEQLYGNNGMSGGD